MKKVFFTGILLLVALAPLSEGQAQSVPQKRKSTDGPSASVPNKANNGSSTTAETATARATTNESSTRPGTANPAINTEEATLTGIYRVGVGDVLDIRLLNSNSSRSTLYTVMDGGWIEFPLVGGSPAVAGLTTDEIKTRLAAELKRRAVAEATQLSVGVRQYASHPVTITGLVGMPGTKMLRREAVPLYVILADAQPRLDAGRATIRRAGVAALTIDLGDASALNVIIKPGDIIDLTTRPQEFYYIAGLVNDPGQKVFQPGITLLQAILAARGLSRSTNNFVELSREGGDGRLVTSKYSLKEIKAGKLRDPRLQAGDRIEVVR